MSEENQHSSLDDAIQAARDKAARQFRSARNSGPEGRALARLLWKAMTKARKEFTFRLFGGSTHG